MIEFIASKDFLRDNNIDVVEEIELPQGFDWGFIDTAGFAKDINGEGDRTYGQTTDDKFSDIGDFRLKPFTVFLTDASLDILNIYELMDIMVHEARHAWQIYNRISGNNGDGNRVLGRLYDMSVSGYKCASCYSNWSEFDAYSTSVKIVDAFHDLNIDVSELYDYQHEAYDFYFDQWSGQQERYGVGIPKFCNPLCETK